MASAERLALNEEIFRAVNDQIATLSRTFGDPLADVGFVCECASIECTDRVALALGEYDDLRAGDGRYVVKRGHELGTELERVVCIRGECFVVEKLVSPA